MNEEPVLDFSNVTRDNVGEYIDSNQLKWMYLVSPKFGGSTGPGNQVVVTPKAIEEKIKIDDELYKHLQLGRAVDNFFVNLDYKGKSFVPSKINISATIDGHDYKRVIDVW